MISISLFLLVLSLNSVCMGRQMHWHCIYFYFILTAWKHKSIDMARKSIMSCEVFFFYHFDVCYVKFGEKSNPLWGHTCANQVFELENAYSTFWSCLQYHIEMLAMHHCNNCFWSKDLSHTQEGVVNFVSAVAHDSLIPSSTRGQPVIVRRSNGIIALIFEISKPWVCSVMTREKYKSAVHLFIYFGTMSDFTVICHFSVPPFVTKGATVSSNRKVNVPRLTPSCCGLNKFSRRQSPPSVPFHSLYR